MPKTTFINGLTVMTAEWCNKAYVTDGGHKHDGVDSDGHAQKINLNTEFTVGAQGKLEAPTESADLHVIRHDHAAAGNAILQTDVLRLHGAPRDATRRAQAPLDQSLYLQNTPKMLYRMKALPVGIGPTFTFNDEVSYNVTSGLAVNPSDTTSYVLTALDGANIQGIIQASFEGWGNGLPLNARVRAVWDDRVELLPYVYDEAEATPWRRLRDQGGLGQFDEYFLTVAVW